MPPEGHNKQPARATRATLVHNSEHDIPHGQNMPAQAFPRDHGNKPRLVDKGTESTSNVNHRDVPHFISFHFISFTSATFHFFFSNKYK